MDLVVVGHQTNHFEHPAITYFAKDMQDKICLHWEQGITETHRYKSEFKHYIEESGVQHINTLFKLGMNGNFNESDKSCILMQHFQKGNFNGGNLSDYEIKTIILIRPVCKQH